MNRFHDLKHETLALRALDHTRLLDGEDSETQQIEDAVHWSAVYWEMIEFKQRLPRPDAQEFAATTGGGCD